MRKQQSAIEYDDYIDELLKYPDLSIRIFEMYAEQISSVIESIKDKMGFLATSEKKTAEQVSRAGLSRQNEILLAKAVEAGGKARKTLEEGGWTTAAQRSRLTAAVRNAVEAEKIFVLANVGLVKSVARKQSQKRALSVTYEDMEQAGYVGLLKALRNFDWRRGFRFSTYAFNWIRKEVGNARASGSMIRVPSARHFELKRVEKLHEEMTVRLQREPTFQEMADTIGLKAGRIEEDLQLVNRYVGFYGLAAMEMFSDTDQSVSEWTRSMPPLELLVERAQIEEMSWNMEVLDSRERTALEMRFGLDGGKAHTYREIEEALGLRKTGGSDFTQKAIKRLKSTAWAQGQAW